MEEGKEKMNENNNGQDSNGEDKSNSPWEENKGMSGQVIFNLE